MDYIAVHIRIEPFSEAWAEIAEAEIEELGFDSFTVEDPFLNAVQVKFAYSLTCHKTQGGQWKHVLIDQGYLTEENLDKEYLRWLYTAVTRSTENVYLINFEDKMFGNEK